MVVDGSKSDAPVEVLFRCFVSEKRMSSFEPQADASCRNTLSHKYVVTTVPSCPF